MRKIIFIIWNWIRTFSLPGFDEIPFYDVVIFFYKKLLSEAITVRGAAIAFKFFIALFPGLIFVFTLIPYFPIENSYDEVMNFLQEFLPINAFETIKSTLTDILLNKRGGLLSFGFISTLYFASNGINSLLIAFNPGRKIRFWKRIGMSLALTFTLTILLVIGIVLVIGGSLALNYLNLINFFKSEWVLFLVEGFRLLIILLLLITIISVLYYVGAAKGERFRLYSPGAFLSTIAIAITSWGFGFYVDNFGNYNSFYGSLGTIIILMMWIYLNSLVLLGGFDFNQSLMKLKKGKRDAIKE